MSVSILAVDDEPDVADLFRHRFRVKPVMDRLALLGKFKTASPLLSVMMITACGDDGRKRVARELVLSSSSPSRSLT